MNRLVEQKNKRREERQKQKARQSWVIPLKIFLWLLGPISIFYVTDELPNTMITYKIPLLLGGLFGLIVAVFIIKDKDLRLLSFICFGCLFIAIPLFINDVFADAKIEEMKQMINVKNHHHKRSGPSVEIKYNDLEKKIYISEDDEQKMDSSSYIILKGNKGLFGYYIVRHYQLIKE